MRPIRALRFFYLDWRDEVAHRKECAATAARLRELAAAETDSEYAAKYLKWAGWCDDIAQQIQT